MVELAKFCKLKYTTNDIGGTCPEDKDKDLLIIDEGFGALDDGNIEACSRLLLSLKKWFKCILVISHIDAIKDVVDNVLDIRNKGKNSLVVHE